VADSIPLEQATKIVDQFIVDLSSAAAHMPTTIRSLAEVPADHVIISNLSHAPELLNLSTQRLEVAMYSAQRVFAKLFDERIQTPVHREVFLSFLDALTTAVPKLRQHLTEWLIFAPETHRYHREVLCSFQVAISSLGFSDVDSVVLDCPSSASCEALGDA